MHKLIESLQNFPFTVMGIVNVTPDSFSDGGKYASTNAAVAHGISLVESGAALLDIGGESTRPGSVEISAEEEIRRVVPVIRELSLKCTVPLCIDTRKASVAQAALDAGANLVNDVSAGRFDKAMAALVARVHVPIILMHSRKTPQLMQQSPHYSDVVAEVTSELLEAAAHFIHEGVKKENLILDVGLGFAKRFEDNIALIQNLTSFSSLGYPLLMGASRKAFIGVLTGREAKDRLCGSLAVVAAGYARGVRMFRVHDVRETVDFLSVFSVL